MNYSESKTPDRHRGIIFTDFDGTLFNDQRYITDSNYKALKHARELGFITSIATGRSLFSFRRVAETLDRPIYEYFDYLIFSSGAGVVRSFEGIMGFGTDITENDIIEKEELSPPDASEAAKLLYSQGIDFMLHKPVPDNHHFTYIKANSVLNPDFYRRIKIYPDYAEALDAGDGDDVPEQIEAACLEGVSQLVAVVPPAENIDAGKYAAELTEFLRLKLEQCSVVRTTSPIDRQSLWIEIFSPEVSKSKAAARLADRLGVSSSDCIAVGNDFNDEDLLRWAGTARTVDEAPELLRNQYRTAGRAEDGAVASAILEFIG